MSHLDGNCLFCKIIEGEVPGYRVFENNGVYTFLNISQVNPGYTSMVPKKHIVDLFDCSQEDTVKYSQYIPMTASAIKKTDPKINGMNIVANNGVSADRVVVHSHIYSIPRFEGDGFKMATRNNADQYTPEKYGEIASEIREEF